MKTALALASLVTALAQRTSGAGSSNDGHAIVHVTIKNRSVEHVTVNWYPRYAIRGGGIHGDRFTSAGSNGFDSGETRSVNSK